MMHCDVGDSHHVKSWAVYVSVIDILVGEAVIHRITKMAQDFVFDLTCDVIGEPEVMSVNLYTFGVPWHPNVWPTMTSKFSLSTSRIR